MQAIVRPTFTAAEDTTRGGGRGRVVVEREREVMRRACANFNCDFETF